jgi:succinate dehydrogenase flavin-adding protein (antitoxin of CptAB toxin-antitoxin module)
LAELDKIRWHCRRGLLELDLILEKFNREHLTKLGAMELDCYTELLALADNDLLDLIMARAALHSPRCGAVLQLLRAV